MTTDLFLATAGVDARTIEAAVPPGCRRGVDLAPVAARDGDDTLLMFGTWTPRRPATHLVPSFAPLTDAPLSFRFEVSALADGAWSPWVATTTIGAAKFAPMSSVAWPLACDVDEFRSTCGVDAIRLRIRVRARATTRWIAALSAADEAPPEVGLPPDAPTCLAVPALSQMQADAALGARICSPTSVAMVLGYWGHAAQPATVAAEVFHPGLDIYGVWPAAVRAAAARGVAGYLLRFPDWSAARWCLGHGIPIVASVRYVAGELTGAAVATTPGHLVVLTGLDGDAVLVNDPAAPTDDAVPRRYCADEFGRVWLARGGVGYVLFGL